MQNQILVAIMVISVVIFAVAAIYYYPSAVRKIFGRLGFCMAGVLGSNYLFSLLGIGLYVGVNPVTVLVMLIMGGPGVLLLYGVEFYCNMVP